jgi:hypothetical protein
VRAGPLEELRAGEWTRGDRGPSRRGPPSRNAGLISDEIMHRAECELDLEDERLEI